MRAAMQAGLEALKESLDTVHYEYTEARRRYEGIPTRKAKLYGMKALVDKHEAAIAQLEAALAAPTTLPAFIRRDVEQAIRSAEHPKGMSTHDGKARIGADRLRYMLRLIDAMSVTALAAPVEPVAKYCQQAEFKAGRAAPRTCPTCKLGPCPYGVSVAAPVAGRVISDAEIDEIARPHSIETEIGIEFTERELIAFARAIIAKTEGE